MVCQLKNKGQMTYLKTSANNYFYLVSGLVQEFLVGFHTPGFSMVVGLGQFVESILKSETEQKGGENHCL